MPLRTLTKTERRVLIRLVAIVAIPMALIALIPALVGLAISWQERENLKRTITRIEDQSVRQSQLEKTNCRLKGFLLEARNARAQTGYDALLASEKATGALKVRLLRAVKTNGRATRGYQDLAETFQLSHNGCELPKNTLAVRVMLKKFPSG